MQGQEETPDSQVVLLSRILEKLDRMEKRLDALESTTAQKRTTLTKAPTKTFADYIRVPEKADEILVQMHRWIDKAYRVDALIYIQAALDAKVFNCKPPFPVLDKEFQGHLGAQSLFYDYVGYDSYKFERQAMELENATKILKQITDK